MAKGAEQRIINRLPDRVLEQLDDEQRGAIVEALAPEPGKQPVDIRLNIPVGGERFYLAVLSGRERRGRERRLAERKAHPLPTVGNLLFILGAVAVIYVLAVLGALLYSSVLIF